MAGLTNFFGGGGGINVGVNNPGGVIYVRGNEFTDGSVRIVPTDEHIDVPHLELRTNGIWADTSLALDAGTLFLGNDVSISTVGSHLQINSREGGTKSLLPETRFDDAGTELPHNHVLGPLQERVVFSPNTVGEIVTSLFELEVASFLTAFRYRYYFKTGSVAATAPVTMTLSKGHAPGGVVVFTQTMPASQWFANTEVVIELEGAISLSVGAPLLLTINSDSDFSLIGDEANGGNFFAMDFQPFSLEDVVTFPTGVKRFMATNSGKIMLDNDGHFMFTGTQGSLSTATPQPVFPPFGDPPPPGI